MNNKELFITDEIVIYENKDIKGVLDSLFNEIKKQETDKEYLEYVKKENDNILKANFDYVIFKKQPMDDYLYYIGVNDKESARDFAIEIQDILSYESLSYGEINDLYEIVENIALKYDLVSEFVENGLLVGGE